MSRNKAGALGLAALAALGLYGVVRVADRAQEGKSLCIASAGATVAQAERWNAEDGLQPGRPFSLDDYCGTQCRPGSLGWQACLDGCRDYCEADEADSGSNPENR